MKPYNRSKLLMWLAAMFFYQWFVTLAIADNLRGEIKTSGDPATRKIILIQESGARTTTICPGTLAFELTQLSGTIVTINGNIQKLKKANENCLSAESYEIHEIAKGRPAIIGALKMIEKGRYAIINASGKTWHLAKLPPGLKDYLNETMVMDLVANDASSKETTWLVARAFKLPTP